MRSVTFHKITEDFDLGMIIKEIDISVNSLDTEKKLIDKVYLCFSRATFEKTMEILTEAAIYNQSDHLKNVSSSIMLGKTFRGGTGICDVMMDNEILENSEFGNVESKMKSHITLTKNNIIDDLIKKKDIRGLFIPQLD